MNKLVAYFRESVDEMRHKVTWPTVGNLQRDSRLVLVASLIFALFIGAIDFGFENLMAVLYSL